MNKVQARDALVGAWRLVSWENRAADGRSSITISRRGRARFTAGDLLTLSASPLLLAGTQQVPRLVWERVDSPQPTASSVADGVRL